MDYFILTFTFLLDNLPPLFFTLLDSSGALNFFRQACYVISVAGSWGGLVLMCFFVPTQTFVSLCIL